MSGKGAPIAEYQSATTGPPEICDVLVIGAGPAGAVAAHQLARQGLSVLIVDRQEFPREKVCGGCINNSAIEMLDREAVLPSASLQGAPVIDSLRVSTGYRCMTLPFPPGRAVLRSRFDQMLVESACQQGARFLPATAARVESCHSDFRRVELRTITDGTGDESASKVAARLVIAADGLSGNSVSALEGFEQRIASDSLIGAGAIVSTDEPAFEKGTVYMAVSQHGYAGVVRIDDQELDVACALNASSLRRYRNPGVLAEHILEVSALPSTGGIGAARWKGTVPLTRSRSRVSGERLFLVGDTASYVEPFTGEGIAWAVRSGLAASQIVLRRTAGGTWDSSLEWEWEATHSAIVSRKQSTARLFSWLLRRPFWFEKMVAVLEGSPWVAERLTRHINS